MTVANTTNRIAAEGNDAIGQEVPFSFPYAVTSDITVYSRVIATGVETLLAETTNYTLTAASDTGGTLTTVTAVAATSEIHIIRNTPKTQALDLEAGGSFSAEDVEDALDKNTKLVIENKDSLDRALRAPATDAVALDLELPSSVDRASKNLGFDANGNVTVTDSDGTFATQTGVYNDFITKSPWFDVRAYGAKADGSTDDYAAIQAAIDAAVTAGGGTVLMPEGHYVTSSSIAMKGGVIFKGVSRSGVEIRPNAETFAAITITGLQIDWEIKNLTINYTDATSGAAASDSSAVGIQTIVDGANYPYFFKIEQVDIFYAYRGFQSTTAFMYSLEHVYASVCGDYGFYIYAPVAATTVRLDHCYVNVGKGGFYLRNILQLTLDVCAVDNLTTGSPFILTGCTGMASSITAEANTVPDNTAVFLFSGTRMLVAAAKSVSNILEGPTEGYIFRASDNADILLMGCNQFGDTYSAGAGTYIGCHGASNVDQLLAIGCAFLAPTGAGGTSHAILGLVQQIEGGTITVNNLQTDTIDITSAQIKALVGTPKELVAAPGAGKLIEFVSAVLLLDYGSEVFAEPSPPDDLAIEYDDGTGQQVITWDTTGFIENNADCMEIVNSASVGGGAAAITTAANVNKNLVLINTGGDYTGNASNDTAIRVIVTYRIHTSLSL